MSRSGPSSIVRVVVACLLGSSLLAGVAEAAPGAKSEERKLVVYRRARCEKPKFGSIDACDALVRWLDSWHIKYDVRDVSRTPAFGLTLSGRCLSKRTSCTEYPIVDDGKTILTGSALVTEMARWAREADPSRYEMERKDLVPEILAKDEPSTPIAPSHQDNSAPQRAVKATDDE